MREAPQQSGTKSIFFFVQAIVAYFQSRVCDFVCVLNLCTVHLCSCSTTKECIQVAVRVRPLLNGEEDEHQCVKVTISFIILPAQ